MATPIFYHAYLKIFQSTCNFHEFVSSTCTKSGYFINLFRRLADLKILQSDWTRAFQPISQELDFSQLWNLCWNIANNINFHYRTNLEKKKINFIKKFKKAFSGPLFGHFPHFGDHRFTQCSHHLRKHVKWKALQQRLTPFKC